MRRGKNQVLYKFLPGKPIDYDQGNAIALVERWCSAKVSVDNKDRLIRRIYSSIRTFESTRGFPKIANPESFELLSPLFIEAELFPLTFVCDACSRAYSFGSVQQFNRVLRRAKCYCGGNLTQMDLIYTHKCGNLWAPKVAQCLVHHYEKIILNKNNSNSPKDWRWECGICKKVTQSLNSRCSSCQNSPPTYPKPFRQTGVFEPHSLTLINLQDKEESRLQEDDIFKKLVIAKYLNLYEMHSSTFEDCLKVSPKEDNKMNAFIAELKAKNWPEDKIEEVLDMMRKANPDSKEVRNKILAEVENLVSPYNGDTTAVAQNAYEFLETLKQSGAVHLKKLVEYSKSKAYFNVETIEKFPSIMESIGVQNAHVLSDLAMIKLVYGFTRGSFDDTSVTLNRFPPDRSVEQGKVPVYMNEASTEAILLEFDRWKILNWLKENGFDINIPEKNNEAELKAWFLNNINSDAINYYSELEDEDSMRMTKWVYKLLHSISHSLILTGSAECGLDKNSMSELIMPSIPCIIIFCNNMQGFQMGGMFTLFESNIHSWIEKTKAKVASCIYDPVCMDHQSACHACLFLSEFSCVHLNYDLGRDFLLGKTMPSRRITGFWSKEFLQKVEK